MTFNYYLSRAAGYLQLAMFDEALKQLDEIDPSERLHPHVLGLRLGILRHLERWSMGAEIARRAVRMYPETSMFYWMGAFHILQDEGAQAALEFFSSGEPYLSGDGWYWYRLSRYQCLSGLIDQAKRSLDRAIGFDSKFRELASKEHALKAIQRSVAIGTGAELGDLV